MLRTPVTVVAALCAVGMVGCSGKDEPEAVSHARGHYRAPSPAPDLRCKRAVLVSDAAGDARAAVPGRQPRISPNGDLRRFELMASSEGVCARWTTAERPRRGTTFYFNVYGPPYRRRRPDVVALQGHGFEIALTREGPRVRDAAGSTTLQAEATFAGRSLSVFVSRAQLNRPRRDLLERRPFPYDAFAFDARVFGALDEHGRHTIDIWPQDTDGQAGWVSGRMCLPDCQERRAIGSATKHPPDGSAQEHVD